MADALLGAGAPAIVAGDGSGAGRSRRPRRAGRVVRARPSSRADVDCVDFPATHPLSAGCCLRSTSSISDRLSESRRRPARRHPRLLSALLHRGDADPGAHPGVLDLDSDRAELGRNYPASIALQGGIGPTIRALTKLTEGHCPEAAGRLAGRRERPGQGRRLDHGPALLERRAHGSGRRRAGVGRRSFRRDDHARGGDHHWPRGPAACSQPTARAATTTRSAAPSAGRSVPGSV